MDPQSKSYEWKLSPAFGSITESDIFEIPTNPDVIQKWKLILYHSTTNDTDRELQLVSFNVGLVTVDFEICIFVDKVVNDTTTCFYSTPPYTGNAIKRVFWGTRSGRKRFSYGDKALNTFLKKIMHDCECLIILCMIDELPSDHGTKMRLYSGLSALLWESKDHDVVLKVGGKKIKAHRNLLCIRSRVFEAMFQTIMKETESGCVEIRDIDAETVQAMIGYMYTGKVVNLQTISAENLMIAADKYHLEELKEISEQQISTELTDENAIKKLQLADLNNCTLLNVECFRYIRRRFEQVINSDSFVNLAFTEGNFNLLKTIVREFVRLDWEYSHRVEIKVWPS